MKALHNMDLLHGLYIVITDEYYMHVRHCTVCGNKYQALKHCSLWFKRVRRSSAYAYTSKQLHNAAQIMLRDESIKHGEVQCAPVVLPLFLQ